MPKTNLMVIPGFTAEDVLYPLQVGEYDISTIFTPGANTLFDQMSDAERNCRNRAFN